MKLTERLTAHPIRRGVVVAGWVLIAMHSFAMEADRALRVVSPNGNHALVVLPAAADSEIIRFSVIHQGEALINPSPLRLLANEISFTGTFSVEMVERRSVDSEWTTALGERSTIPEQYNEMKLGLASADARISLICRAYNEGVAFAYEIPEQGGHQQLGIDDELISYRFSADHNVWSTPKRRRGRLTAQGRYRRIPMSRLEPGAERPLLIECGQDRVIALAEAALVDYARISYDSDPAAPPAILSSLDGRMEKALQDKVSGALQSERSAADKATVHLPFRSPWRVVMIGQRLGELLENNYLVLNLNAPSAIEDPSWIKPGKVLRETTLTTEGGLRAIDFVAANGMQYVHFDAGWYGHEMDDDSDAATVTLDPKRSQGPFDLEAILAHAKQKDVRVMLYVNRRALETQLDELLPLYREWGISGIKFGFVRVGDQDATAWLHEAVRKAAAYGMVVDVHDEYRPTGYSRTYPNLLTQEGIRGDETTVPNEHTLITMFTRMLAGAADNTVCYYNERVEEMGSHASQLAKTVCLFSPLQFLYWYDRPAESPDKEDGLWGDTEHIGNEPELAFFRQVPTTWDETKVLVAEIAEVGVIARRKGADWYVGGINGTTARDVTLDFSFLYADAVYAATIYTDDEQVKTRTRVKVENQALDAESQLKFKLKPNTGFAIQLKKRP